MQVRTNLYFPRKEQEFTRNNTFCRVKPLPCDEVSFKGHAGHEKYGNRLGYLVSETGLFRDSQTNNFVKQYLKETFGNKPQWDILIGGCSSGEQAITYNMMLNDSGKEVNILGFDLSEKSISEAQKGRFLMQSVKDSELAREYGITAIRDSYLWKDVERELTDEEKANKKLFDDYFKESSEKVPVKTLTFSEKINRFFTRFFLKKNSLRFESKYFLVNPEKVRNVQFKVGDIKNIEEIADGKKYDVITFTHALYHMTTFYEDACRIPAKDAEEVVENIAKKVKNCLNKDGIFVVGENECLNMMNKGLLPKVMKKCGFELLNETSEHEANVFRKCTDL